MPIGSITIVAYNVFEREAFHDPKLLYWAADHLHKKTLEVVIRNELLFSVGDRCDPKLLAETERNIRALSIIRRADVTAVVNAKGTVDVIVRTYDAWTLELTASFSRVGGQNDAKAGLSEGNIGGLGVSASGVYSRANGAPSTSFRVKDPMLLGKKVEYSVLAMTSPTSRSYGFGVNRPFFTSIIPSAFGVNGSYSDSNSGADPSGTTRTRTTDLGAHYGVAFATSTERVRRMTFGLRHHIAEYGPGPGAVHPALPHDEHLTFLQLGWEWAFFDFIKERQIQKFSHDEDINLGFAALPALEFLPAGAYHGARLMPVLSLTKGYHWESGQLLLLNGGYISSYVDGSESSRIGRAAFSFYSRSLPRQTMAVHAAIDRAFHLDPASPIGLGEDTGLRGYGAGHFSGDRRFLMNIEDRFYLKNELWSVADLGAVLFFDSGYVWPKGAPARFADLKNAVGIGFRIAPSRSGSNSPVRIDLAYALNDNRARSPWLLSILAGQSF